MKSYRFSCAVRISAPGKDHDGRLIPITGLMTPLVEAETPSAAIYHPETQKYCEENKCTIYRMVK